MKESERYLSEFTRHPCSRMRCSVFAILAFVGIAGTALACGVPKPPPPDPNPDDGNGAGDPTFMLPDNRPGQPLQKTQSSLANIDNGSSAALSTLSESESAILSDIVRKITDGASTEALTAAMVIWHEDHSSDLKKAILLQAMTRTRSSDEVQTMQFMCSALDDLPAQKEKLAELARGNGLEKQLATKRILILNQNPQTRIAE